MRKAPPLLVILLLALAGVCVFLFVQNRQTGEDYRALQKQSETTNSRYDQALEDIGTIQDSLDAIVLTTDAKGMKSSSLNAERRLSPNRGDAALERASELRAGIQRARDRIRTLEQRLGLSGAKVSGLEHMLKRLKQDLATKELQVARLTGQVDSLQSSVAGLAATVEQSAVRISEQEGTLEERRRELSTIYYVVGTRRELLNAGIVAARGGLFGFGKTLQPVPEVNEARFQAIDTDQQTSIPVAARRPRVLTAQPTSSFRFEAVEGQFELRIVDVRAFRTVRRLVVVTD